MRKTASYTYSVFCFLTSLFLAFSLCFLLLIHSLISFHFIIPKQSRKYPKNTQNQEQKHSTLSLTLFLTLLLSFSFLFIFLSTSRVSCPSLPQTSSPISPLDLFWILGPKNILRLKIKQWKSRQLI